MSGRSHQYFSGEFDQPVDAESYQLHQL